MSALDDVALRFQANVPGFLNAANSIVACLPLSMSWIETEINSAENIPAISLLAGSKLALLEASTAWALGLDRAAAASLRIYTENMFAWLYYKDHPVEFRQVENKTFDLFLPKAVQSYLKNIDGSYETAYNLASKFKNRPSEYFYTDISHYIHAHPSQMIVGKDLADMVVSQPPNANFLTICNFCDEFISDNYLTYYRHSWGLIPKKVTDNIEQRLGDKLPKFISIG